MDKTEHYFDLRPVNGNRYKLEVINGELQICIENDIQEIRDEIEFLKLKNEVNSDEDSREKIKQKIELLEKNNESLQVQNLDDIIKMCKVELEKQQGLQKPQNIYEIKSKMAEITRLKAEILEKEKEIDNLHNKEEAVEQARRKYTQQLQENEKKLKQIQQDKSKMISDLINDVNKKIEQNNEEIARLEQEKNDKINEATKKNGKPLSDVQSQYIENAYKTKQDKIEQDNEKLRLVLNPANYNKYIDQKIDEEKRKIEQANEEIKKRLEKWLEYTKKRENLHSEVKDCKERIKNYRADIDRLINIFNKTISNDTIIEQLMRLAITANDLKKKKMNFIEKNSFIEYERTKKKLIQLYYQCAYYNNTPYLLTEQEQKKHKKLQKQIRKLEDKLHAKEQKYGKYSIYGIEFEEALIANLAIKELHQLSREHQRIVEARKLSERRRANAKANAGKPVIVEHEESELLKKMKKSKFYSGEFPTALRDSIRSKRDFLRKIDGAITEGTKELEGTNEPQKPENFEALKLENLESLQQFAPEEENNTKKR